MTERAFPYTYGQLSVAVDILATGKEDARMRVANAILACHTLTDRDFPEDLRAEWKSIKEEATKFGPFLDGRGDVKIGSAHHTMTKRRNVTAKKLAARLVELHRQIGERTRDA